MICMVVDILSHRVSGILTGGVRGRCCSIQNLQIRDNISINISINGALITHVNLNLRLYDLLYLLRRGPTRSLYFGHTLQSLTWALGAPQPP